jgi:hypothetical protein
MVIFSMQEGWNLWAHELGIIGRVGRATACYVLCHWLNPCRRLPRGVAVDFCPKQSGWLINQLDDPSLFISLMQAG